jgi:hypothetical protein
MAGLAFSLLASSHRAFSWAGSRVAQRGRRADERMTTVRGVGRRALALGLLLFASEAGAVKISIKGSAALEGRVLADGDARMIRGTLRDDVGAPVGGARVSVDVLSQDGKPVLALPTPLPCSTAVGQAPRATTAAEYVMDTDGQGVFCARAAQFPSRGVLRLRFAGKPGLAATSVQVPFDAERPMPSLAWDPRPDVIDLDLPQAKVSVVASSRSSAGRPLEGLGLVLEADDGKVLARSRTDERGRATFDLASSQLSGPGQGDLVVRAEEKAAGLLPLRASVQRAARVTLVATPPAEAIVPRDGHRFEAVAETSRGPVSGGVIEAKIGREVVGAGAVVNGRAGVVTTFDVPSEGVLDVTFSYVSASPELRPGEALVLRVPVRPPSLWRRAPLLAAGLLVLAWLARGWRRPPRAARAQAEKAQEKPGQAAPLPAFVEEVERGAKGWRGVVLDAHDQRPLRGVAVSVVARDFLGERRVIEVVTGADGSFEFETGWDQHRMLVVEGPLHARVERALPRPGRVSVGLTSRRRALLDRLIVAVKRAGGWGGGGEPTPGQVAKGLEEQNRQAGARWAQAVEEAAFGRDPVDAAGEAKVAAMEIDLARREAEGWVRR